MLSLWRTEWGVGGCGDEFLVCPFSVGRWGRAVVGSSGSFWFLPHLLASWGFGGLSVVFPFVLLILAMQDFRMLAFVFVLELLLTAQQRTVSC